MENVDVIMDKAVEGTEVVIEKATPKLLEKVAAMPTVGKVGLGLALAGGLAAAGFGIYKGVKFLVKKFKKEEVKEELNEEEVAPVDTVENTVE